MQKFILKYFFALILFPSKRSKKKNSTLFWKQSDEQWMTDMFQFEVYKNLRTTSLQRILSIGNITTILIHALTVNG